MQRPHLLLIAAVALGVLLVPLAPYVLPNARQASPATSLEQRYFALVQRYQQGDLQASAEILTWKESDVRKANEGLSRLVVRQHQMTAGEVAARFRAAAVMMHTDAGLAELDRGKTRSVHLETAYRMMRDSATSPFGASDSTLSAFTLRNWVLAVTDSLIERTVYDIGRSLLGFNRAGAPYAGLIEGTDRDMLLTAGVLEEASAFTEFRASASGAAATPGASSEIESTAFMRRQQQVARERLSTGEARQRAERLYRRVLQLDAACHEARLRLGRVLFDEGRSAEAAGHLERVLADTDQSRQRHLAALFLGALREKEGQMEAAVRLYSRALDSEPRSQTARVALAAALDSTGQQAAARETIAPLAGRRAANRSYTDPWWAYALGQGDQDRLSRLRATVVAR